MVHFIYKTTHTNGKYYVGRHSTENIDDGYIGSGMWPRSVKDRTTLTREVLEYAVDVIELKLLEARYLAEHYGKLGCMNRTSDPIGFDTTNNPMKNPLVAAKLSGDNHWTHKDPNSSDKLRKAQEKLIEEGRHPLVGDRNPNKDGRSAKSAMSSGNHINLTNNPSIWRSEAGIHHWQNGNSPNAGGKLNEIRIAARTHNLLGPTHNRKMIADGKNPWIGADSNLKRLAEGTHPSQMKKTCEHCGKTVSVSMYARWHGPACRDLQTQNT